ncbi:MAG: hypothetical protein K6G81_02015, partial [Lachnospiraceae bacterium]|nr:hypothetical protein [Lachnospiraceae bacterium]
ITEIDLKMYTQEWVNREHPKKSVFFAYKGILNQIFTYAFKHRIISENPVEQIKNQQYLKSCDTRKPKAEENFL